MRWTVYTRVIDNLGDVGFAWRLAASLARRGEHVRLAVDDSSALSWMAPAGVDGVTVVPWDDDGVHPNGAPDAIVETFGAGVSNRAVAAAAESDRLPVRVNVEHLSAEAYTLRSHGLCSPHRLADGRLFPTWFFFPGFVAASGGLLREPGLLASREGFNRRAWLASQGLVLRADECVVSMFGYEQPALPALLDLLSTQPTLLLLSPGPSQRDARTLLGDSMALGHLRAVSLPYLTQPDYDRCLWSCDLALVRGEDSPVRAIWAGVPFVWQFYRQKDGAHAAKLHAFLDFYLQHADPSLARDVRNAFAAWNGLSDLAQPASFPVADPSSFEAWRRHAVQARGRIAEVPDLATALHKFVSERR